MKGIAKDHESITKDYKVFFTVWKINVKKFHIISQAIHSNSPVVVGSFLHLWYNSGI